MRKPFYTFKRAGKGYLYVWGDSTVAKRFSEYKERDIEKYLRKEVKKRGGEIRKVKWIGRRGAPDNLVWVQGFDFPKWAEMKRPGKKLESHQRREKARLEKMGMEMFKLDTFEDVDKFLGPR